ncbi:MAG: D-glycero-alpha-D-manno-heptose-1,7-bisphosphate 7-phosphatase [Phycisphaerales bacterium]
MPDQDAQPRPAIFFDRDDTLIACRTVTPDGDLGDPALVQLLPGALEACRALKRAGYFLAVVSNQGGVARGKYGLDQVGACNDRLNELLEHAIDAFRFCPYHPSGTVCGMSREHPWRKPAPGMLLDIAQHHHIDLARSWMIGDAERDVEAGLAAGCRAIRVAASPDEPTRAHHRASTLSEAASIILDPVARPIIGVLR